MNLFQYQRMVFESSLKSRAKLVLAALSSWASGPDGEIQGVQGWRVWPPAEDLQTRTSMSSRTLQRVIRSIEDSEGTWITRGLETINGKLRAVFLLHSNPCQSVQPTSICQGVNLSYLRQNDVGNPRQSVRGTTSIEETSKETRAAASAAHGHEREETAGQVPVAPQRQQQDQTGQDRTQAQAASEDTTQLEEIWRQTWGMCPLPAPLASLTLREGLSAIAALLHKRNSPRSIANLATVTDYVLADLREGRRVAWSGWTLPLLLLVREGQTPQEVQQRESAKAASARALACRPEFNQPEPERRERPPIEVIRARQRSFAEMAASLREPAPAPVRRPVDAVSASEVW